MAFSIEKSLANHAVSCEQFGQLLEGAGAVVSDVVVAVVPKAMAFSGTYPEVWTL